MDQDYLERDGFCLLECELSIQMVEELRDACARVFEEDSTGVLARSSRGHVYAARNLIDSIPLVRTVWQHGSVLHFLSETLGDRFGLVRALFFDKPPDRSWGIAWHRDSSIAVSDNSIGDSTHFSRPTIKAGVPHVIACDEVLRRMVTLRIHLDEVTDENGPLQVVPQSHFSSDSDGLGIEQAVSVFAEAGQILAMRPLIVHGSGASRPGTCRHRRILHLEFSADPRLPDGYAWHRFVEPTASVSN